MGCVIIIHESRDCIVMTTSHHARRSFLRREFFDIGWFVGGVGRIAANHFLVFAQWYALPLQLLNIFEARQDLMLDNEDSLHLILAAFLYREGFLLERVEGATGGEVDGDVGSAFYLKGERLDDAEARVIWVRYCVPGTDTKRSLPSVQSFVFLILKKSVLNE